MKNMMAEIKKNASFLKKIGLASGLISAVSPARRNNIPSVSPESVYASSEGDRLHFLNVGRAGCILIQSGSHFALVDCADKAHFQTVSDYLKNVAADESGNVKLDFVVFTHAHSGHIGAAEELFGDEKISVDTVYIKELCEENLGNKEERLSCSSLRSRAIISAKQAGTVVCTEISAGYFDFGSFRLRFVNIEPDNYHRNIDENDNSLGLIVSKADKKILLTGDMTDRTGDLARLADLVGRVDVFELPRHGEESLKKDIVKALSPEVIIAANSTADIPAQVLGDCMLNCNATVYSTVENGGLIITVADSGELRLTNNIHKEERITENA